MQACVIQLTAKKHWLAIVARGTRPPRGVSWGFQGSSRSHCYCIIDHKSTLCEIYTSLKIKAFVYVFINSFLISLFSFPYETKLIVIFLTKIPSLGRKFYEELNNLRDKLMFWCIFMYLIMFDRPRVSTYEEGKLEKKERERDRRQFANLKFIPLIKLSSSLHNCQNK